MMAIFVFFFGQYFLRFARNSKSFVSSPALGRQYSVSLTAQLHTRPLRAWMEPQVGVSPPRRSPLVYNNWYNTSFPRVSAN